MTRRPTRRGAPARIVPGSLIVSCQAKAEGPLDAPASIRALALAALAGGAQGLRLEGEANLRAVRSATTLPIIGFIKRRGAGAVYITPELAESAQVGEASVMRLCRDLRFRGFQEFKLVLAADLARTPETAPEGVLQRVTEAALRALSDTSALLAADLARTLEPALARLEATRTLLICGAGASGISAQDYVYKFLRLGYGVTVPGDPHLAAMSVATLPEGALLIALTRSGTTIDTVRTLELARARGLASLLITERAKSPAVAAADVVIYTASGESTLTGGSSTSKIGQLLVLDALFSELSERLPGWWCSCRPPAPCRGATPPATPRSSPAGSSTRQRARTP